MGSRRSPHLSVSEGRNPAGVIDSGVLAPLLVSRWIGGGGTG